MRHVLEPGVGEGERFTEEADSNNRFHVEKQCDTLYDKEELFENN
jgi:hypothetical protein